MGSCITYQRQDTTYFSGPWAEAGDKVAETGPIP